MNSGTNWLNSKSGVTTEWRNFHFVYENNCWIAGFGGKILPLFNCGAYWNQKNSYITTDLYAVTFVDELTV